MTRATPPNAILCLALACACGAPDDDSLPDIETAEDEFHEDEEASDPASAEGPTGSAPTLELVPDGDPTKIVDPTPVPSGVMTGIVQVSANGGGCSGVLIADDTVLTAGHCVCTANLIGGDVCTTEATVTFQPNPATPLSAGQVTDGEVTWHPDYERTIFDGQIENDLAIVKLDAPAPGHAVPFKVSAAAPKNKAWVIAAGLGHAGADCGGDWGTPFYDVVKIDGFEDGGDIIRIDSKILCGGDYGGPLLNSSGDTLFGIHSVTAWTPFSGDMTKIISTAAYHDWIKGETCGSGFWNACDSSGPICQCESGDGDCDFDDDCVDGNVCDQDVGEVFGYPATADVCVPEGVCGCESNGPFGSSDVIFDGCPPGTYAACPSSWFGGACSCVDTPVFAEG